MGSPLRQWSDESGRVYMSVCPTAAGLLLDVPDVCRFAIAKNGGSVDCHPTCQSRGLWKRYLVAQVLPMVAVLQGLEVLHASAVAIGPSAFALSGPSGTGKSTLALSMVAAGARFVADDVAAIEVSDAGLHLHPAGSLAFVATEPPAGGRAVDAYVEPAYEIPQTVDEPVHLAGLYLLEGAEAITTPKVVLLERLPITALFVAAFSLALRDPGRRRQQLECYAAIDAHVAVFKVQVPRGEPRAVGDVLAEHAALLARQ